MSRILDWAVVRDPFDARLSESDGDTASGPSAAPAARWLIDERGARDRTLGDEVIERVERRIGLLDAGQ